MAEFAKCRDRRRQRERESQAGCERTFTSADSLVCERGRERAWGVASLCSIDDHMRKLSKII